MKEQLKRYIRAGYPGLYIVSHEEQRVEAELKAVADELKHKLYAWSITDGMVDTATGSAIADCHDAVDTLKAVSEMPENSIVLLRDYHLFFEEANPVTLRTFKDELLSAKTKGRTLCVLACRLKLPAELEREMTVVEFALPGREEIHHVLEGIIQSAKLKKLENKDRASLIDAATGLTTQEAENAFALSVVETGKLDPAVVGREKALTIKKNGLLEIVNTKESLDSIGGLDVLKDWLIQRKEAFSDKAKKYGLPTARGLLIIGIPGTGKSLTAKATAKVFGLPLLKLDAGRIFGGLLGQSESNLRSVIQTAEAIAPCCLWIDELEKSFSGSKSSGMTDGGTSSRVFGSFISWMQEKTKPVFIVATANDVSQLPPEFLRKGRWDDLFFCDLPNQDEREAIWNIQISKYGRKPEEFDLVQLAKATAGLTGSEIEGVFVDALYQAFAADREPTDLTIAQVLNDFVPLSKLMSEQINGLRQWAKGRARLATSTPKSETRLRKIAA
ncbi:MAG: AAA family ATPase [Verrucomicrobia bacterium]|nr:AAA family ATPase [Verrucomicrobiota bacterium]